MTDLETRAARMLGVGFDGITIPANFQALLDRGVSNVILFSRNVDSAKQVQDLCAELKRRSRRALSISIDHEGGRVMRLRGEFTDVPSAREIGQANDDKLAYQVG